MRGRLSAIINADVWESGTAIGADVIEITAEQYRMVNEKGVWSGSTASVGRALAWRRRCSTTGL